MFARIVVGTAATRGSTELANIWDGSRSCWAAGRRTGVPPTLGSPNLTQPSTNQLGCGTQRLQTKPVLGFLFRRLGLVCLSVLLLYICALSQHVTELNLCPGLWCFQCTDALALSSSPTATQWVGAFCPFWTVLENTRDKSVSCEIFNFRKLGY